MEAGFHTILVQEVNELQTTYILRLQTCSGTCDSCNLKVKYKYGKYAKDPPSIRITYN